MPILPTRSIATSIEIAAPPTRVWEVLTDFPAHAEWNPFITSIAGPLTVGGRLEIFVQPPGGRGMRFKPRLLAADPARELRWRGKLLLPGLFDGEHRFRLEAVPGGTRLHHGERFSGLLVATMSAAALGAIEQGFVAMNEALKARAES